MDDATQHIAATHWSNDFVVRFWDGNALINAGMWTIGILKTGNELGMDLEAVQSLSREDIIERLRPIENKLRKAGAHFVVEDIAGVVAVVDKINALLEMGHTPSSY